MKKTYFIQKIGRRLWSRGHMLMICLVTVIGGVLISKSILFFDFMGPQWRYLISVVSSYGIFLLTLYIWLRYYFGSKKKQLEKNSGKNGEIDIDPTAVTVSKKAVEWQGQGGISAGAGASESWAAGSLQSSMNGNGAMSSPPLFESPPNFVQDSAAKASKGFDLDIDVDVPFIAGLILVLVILASAGFFIFAAEEILLEIAFEFSLGVGFLTAFRRAQESNWKQVMLKKTILPFVVISVFAFAFGYFIQRDCPEARSFAQYRQMCSFLSKK